MPTNSIWATTVKFPNTVNLILYVVIWVIIAAAFYFIFTRGRAAKFNMRWTTQDILILAVMGVLLEVYDNLIGDQFITPVLKLLPFSTIIHDFAFNDIPYMFLLMVGIALIRKPGAATALVFVNYLLMQLLFGSDRSTVLWWQYGVLQGIFVDVYFVARGRQIFQKANGQAIIDGLVMGALRAVPAVLLEAAIIGPWLSGSVRTLGDLVLYSSLNMIGNGLAAGLLSPLAIRVAQSINQNADATAALPAESSTPTNAPATPAAEGGA